MPTTTEITKGDERKTTDDINLLAVSGELLSDTNPVPTSNYDHNNRNSETSLFGEAITGNRVIYSAAVFQYGLPSGTAVPDIVGSGGLSFEDNLLKISTGTDTNGAIAVQSANNLRFIAGQEAFVTFSWIYTAPAVDSHNYIGIMTSEDGFYIGFNGINFVYGRRKGGVEFQTIVNITDINNNFHGGTLDLTKLNVFKITYGYGCPTTTFQIMRPDGTWYTFGLISYPSSSDTPLTDNAYLPIRAEITNTGNTTNMIGCSDFVSSGVITTGPITSTSVRRFGAEFSANIVAGSTLLALFRNKTEFFGKTNYVNSFLKLITTATDGNKSCKFKIVKNPVIINTPTWADADSDSTHEVSFDGVIDVASFNMPPYLPWEMAKVDTFFEDVTNFFLELRPGDTAAFIVTSSGSSDIDIGLRWDENF